MTIRARDIVRSCLLIILMSFSPPSFANDISIIITTIVANDHIAGEIHGLSTTSAEAQYCVVVYVHTDKWYIHPFATGGEGQSWVGIKDNKWSIPTVKRDFPADEIAAVLLKRYDGDCPAPYVIDSISTVFHDGNITILNLKESQDYGKL